MKVMPNIVIQHVVLGGPGQLDRIEVESSESPAAPANDTSVW